MRHRDDDGLVIADIPGLVEANSFGTGHGLADRVYFTGEEASGSAHPHGGSEWALDVATGDLWAVPAFGRGLHRGEDRAPVGLDPARDVMAQGVLDAARAIHDEL